MGIRESMNRNRAAGGAIAAVLLVLGIAAIVYQNTQSHVTDVGQRFWVSVDDGKTYFLDTSGQLPPFEIDGKTAVRARVFSKDGGQTKIIGFLERFTPEGKKKLQAALAAPAPGGASNAALPQASGAGLMDLMISATEVKRPGEKDWVPQSNFARSSPITTILANDGLPAEPIPP